MHEVGGRAGVLAMSSAGRRPYTTRSNNDLGGDVNEITRLMRGLFLSLRFINKFSIQEINFFVNRKHCMSRMDLIITKGL